MSGTVAEDEIDLRELLALMAGGKWLVALVAGGLLALGLLYAWAATRIYDADALVQVEQDDSGLNAAIGDMAELLGSETAVTAEIELLRSRMIVGSVVDGLQLEISAQPRYFPVFGRALARGFDPVAEGADVAPARLGLRQFAWGGEYIKVEAFDVPARYLDVPFTLVAKGEEGDSYDLKVDDQTVLSGRVGERASVALSSRGEILSIFVQDLIAESGTEFVVTRLRRMDAIEAIQANLGVTEKGKDSGILAVTFSSPDAVKSREVVNRLVIAYQRQNIERRSAEAAQTLSFLEQQLPQVRNKLEAAEASFNSYRLKEGSADLTKETELILQQSVQLETSRLELEQRRQEALQRFTPNHPTVLAIDRQLQDIKNEQDAITGRVKGLPETQQELLRLSRDVEVNTTLYTSLLNNYQELQVAKAGTIGNVRIVDYAVEAAEPSKPKVPLILALSAVLGVFLGVAVVFVRHALKSAVNDPAEVERMTGIPTYATVPYTDDQRRLLKRAKGGSEQLLALADPKNIAIEALRSLRTSLHFAMLDASNNVLMLTGPSPDLGKSFVSINLGAVLAMTGKRVVVVDGDLRRGHLNEYVSCSRDPGLSDYCAGQAEFGDVVRRTPVDGLCVVPTGTIPPNPAELLLTDRFVDLVKALSEQFDYVVIDTPPILAVTDAAIVGKLVGCTLMVLKAGEHPMPMIQETAMRLQNAGVNIKGTIFNQVGRGGSGYHAYKYGYQYSYKRYA